MASTVPKISVLAAQTVHNVTNTPQAWTAYLETASRLYKYKFLDQFLIYAQSPDATACMALNDWNRKMRRYVNPGSKGIALFVKDRGKWGLRYVFDVAATHPGKNGLHPQLWKMRPEHEKTVRETLEKAYGHSAEMDFTRFLQNISTQIVHEKYKETYKSLLNARGGSLLEGLDNLNMEAVFRDTLTVSVQYMVLSRYGIDAKRYLEVNNFRGVCNSTPPLH